MIEIKSTDKNKSKQYKLFIENLPKIVYFQDVEQKYCFGSKRAHLFLENGIDEELNSTINSCEFTVDLQYENNFVLANKKQIVYERIAYDKNLQEHWYKITKSPITYTGGKIEGIVTIIENIDKIKQSEIQQNLFLGTLAHDLKNITQAHIRSLKLMQKGAFDGVTASQKEILDMTIESTDFMNSLLCSIIKTCKENNGIIRLECSYFDMNEIIKTCIREVKILGGERGVCINFEPQNQEVIVYADKSLLRRVVENILNNVVSHSYDNAQINVELMKYKNKIVFSFENQSQPISDKLKEKIFDKYVSSRRNGFNVGLGLYFCKKVINAHEGKIYLENEGTKNKFVVELPIVSESDLLHKEIAL